MTDESRNSGAKTPQSGPEVLEETNTKAEETISDKMSEIKMSNVPIYTKMLRFKNCTMRHSMFDKDLLNMVNTLKEDENTFRYRYIATFHSSSFRAQMFKTVFDPTHEKFVNYRPDLINVLRLLVQYASSWIHEKLKPLMWNAVAALDPNENKVNMTIYSNMSFIVGKWAFEAGDGKCIYELLRHITTFYAEHHAELDVLEYLSCIQRLTRAVSRVAPLEPKEAYDSRIWDVEIQSVLGRLLELDANQLSDELREMVWNVISTMAKIGGIAWLKLDKTFCRMAIQMNFVELQTLLQDDDRPKFIQFPLHFIIFEQYTNAILEKELFVEEGEEEILKAVADTTRFLLTYWVDAFLEKKRIRLTMYRLILQLAISTFRHKHFLFQEERVEKHFGAAMLDTVFKLFENYVDWELKECLEGPLTDMIKKLNEIEILNETVPVFILKYLDKMRLVLDYKAWKQRVFECRECLIELRCRIDWYSVESIQEAKDLLPRFTEPEQHELSHIFRVLYDLPPFVQ